VNILTSAKHQPSLPAVADLYGDLEPIRPTRWRDYLPGLLVSALAALASAFLSTHYGAPYALMALLVGLSLNFLGTDERLTTGLRFASQTLLRVGIVLLGARITLGQIASLGWEALAGIIIMVALTFATGIVVSKRMGLGAAFGTLAGGAVAICGASAALALATMLGERRVNQAQLALVLVGISAMSAAAMITYPILCQLLAFDDRQAGLVLGGAIHDVAQALGAGYSFSQLAGQNAAVVKLTRVALLAPVLAGVSYFYPLDGERRKSPLSLPWFVAGFFILSALTSIGVVPYLGGQWANDTSAGLLAWALAATGIRAPLSSLRESGPLPLIVIAAASATSLATMALLAFLFIR
jgi:uncharacterized integral membrane protein (TIGR00698 family)